MRLWPALGLGLGLGLRFAGPSIDRAAIAVSTPNGCRVGVKSGILAQFGVADGRWGVGATVQTVISEKNKKMNVLREANLSSKCDFPPACPSCV